MRNKRFEEWYARRIDMPVDYVVAMWDGYTYTSRQYHVELAWAAWCASRGDV